MVAGKQTSVNPRLGVSSILVVGGAGDYLDVADTVLLLDNYTVVDVTSRAKEIAASRPAHIPCLPPMVCLTMWYVTLMLHGMLDYSITMIIEREVYIPD